MNMLLALKFEVDTCIDNGESASVAYAYWLLEPGGAMCCVRMVFCCI